METLVVRVDPERPDLAALQPAADALRAGGIVAVPTETVYGLAVDLDRPEAVERLLALRGSPAEKRLTVHVGSLDAAERTARIPPNGLGRRMVNRLLPGPVTLIFPAPGGGDVGIRFPAHRACAELLRLAGVRAGVPSANRSGGPPATDAQGVLKEFGGRIEAVVDAGPSRHGAPSTVVRLTGPQPEILREGARPREDIEALGYRSVLFVCTGNTCRSPMAEAIFRTRLEARIGAGPARRWRVASAGTGAAEGAPLSDGADDALRELGVASPGGGSRGLTMAMVQDADVIYVMTARHRDAVLEWMPECRESVKLLDPDGRDIEDPIGGGPDRYRACARRIAACVERRLEELT